MRSVRWALLALIVALLGFFVYTNVDYFLTVADRFEDVETVEAKNSPRWSERLFASAKARNASVADTVAPSPERRNVDDILGGPMFSDGDLSLLNHMSSVLRQMDTAREPVRVVRAVPSWASAIEDDEDEAGFDEVEEVGEVYRVYEVDNADGFGIGVHNEATEVAAAGTDVDADVGTSVDTGISVDVAEIGTDIDADVADVGTDAEAAVAVIDVADHIYEVDADSESVAGVDVRGIVNAAVNTVVDVWNSGSAAVIGGVNTVVSAVVDIWNSGSSAVIGVVNAVVNEAADMRDSGGVAAVIEAVSAVVNDIVDTIAGIVPSPPSPVPVAAVQVDTAAYAPPPVAVTTDTVVHTPPRVEEVAVAEIDTVPVAVGPTKPVVAGKFLLADIDCRLADRDDLLISVSVELFYDSAVLRDEVNFKRGTLTAIVGSVVRGYEYGDVALPSLRADLLNSFNRVLREGALTSVNIQDFRVEQVAFNR